MYSHCRSQFSQLSFQAREKKPEPRRLKKTPPMVRCCGAAPALGETEGDCTKLKKWRKSTTEGLTPTNVSHACARSARVRMALGVRCTMWRPYSSSAAMKNGKKGGTCPTTRKGEEGHHLRGMAEHREGFALA